MQAVTKDEFFNVRSGFRVWLKSDVAAHRARNRDIFHQRLADVCTDVDQKSSRTVKPPQDHVHVGLVFVEMRSTYIVNDRDLQGALGNPEAEFIVYDP